MKARETKGFTLIEVLVVLAIFGILASMVIAQVLRARLATNEASAIGSLRAINTAQESYSQKCHGYAPVLTELKLAGNYLSPDLTGGASVGKSGYLMTVVVASTARRLSQCPPAAPQRRAAITRPRFRLASVRPASAPSRPTSPARSSTTTLVFHPRIQSHLGPPRFVSRCRPRPSFRGATQGVASG